MNNFFNLNGYVIKDNQMIEKKRILYTFDVEVFFKQCGSSQQLIENNCNLILQSLNEFNVKGVFYIDATHYWYAKKCNELNVISYYQNLITKLLSADHEIGLHTHPHWFDAIGRDKHYDFSDLRHYSTAKAAKSHLSTLQEVICTFITAIKQIDQNYKIITYRAGGYCSQPYEYTSEILKDTDVFVDSSVVPGMKSDFEPFSFNYTQNTTDEPYFFSTNNTQKDPNGENIEFPVYTFQLSSFRRIFEKFKRINSENYKHFGEGSGLYFNNSFGNKFKPVRKVITTDDSDVSDIIWAIKRDRVELITLVNHPKLLSRAGLRNLRKTIDCFRSTTLLDELKSLNHSENT